MDEVLQREEGRPVSLTEDDIRLAACNVQRPTLFTVATAAIEVRAATRRHSSG